MNKFLETIGETLFWFYLIIILLLLGYSCAKFLIHGEEVELMPEYDYKINLDYDKIEVYREHEKDIITIHPDSLQYFIEMDNL